LLKRADSAANREVHNEEGSADRFKPAGFGLRFDEALEIMLGGILKNGSSDDVPNFICIRRAVLDRLKPHRHIDGVSR
jgi:hypothetical protein